MLSEEERLKVCEQVAIDMYTAGMGWNYDAIERLTRPSLLTLKALESVGMAVEMERLNRHQRRARRHV